MFVETVQHIIISSCFVNSIFFIAENDNMEVGVGSSMDKDSSAMCYREWK